MRFVAILFCLCLAAGLSGAPEARADQIRGTLVAKSIDGETACYLKLKNGRMVDLGYLEEIARRDNVSCIVNNIITNKEITLVGKIFEDNGNLLFFENDFECAKGN